MAFVGLAPVDLTDVGLAFGASFDFDAEFGVFVPASESFSSFLAGAEPFEAFPKVPFISVLLVFCDGLLEEPLIPGISSMASVAALSPLG